MFLISMKLDTYLRGWITCLSLNNAMKLLKPKALQKGDCIAIIAPSRYIGEFHESLEKGISVLEGMGFFVQRGKYLQGRWRNASGTVDERLEDFNEALRDRKVRAIFCALGGDCSNQLLEQLDYEALKDDPKLIMGFSDITHFLLAIQRTASVVTVHGPNIKDVGVALEEGVSALEHFITGSADKIPYSKDLQVIRPGNAEGALLGGNLFVLNSLLATPYMPELDNKIIFIEDIDEGISTISFQLQRLRLTGALERIAGMVIGHVIRDKSTSEVPLDEVVLEATKDFSFPIVKVGYFGHGLDVFYPIPLGTRAAIDSGKKEFKLIENPLA